VGVREDLGLEPVHPKPMAYRYSVRDALPWIAGCQEMAGYNGHRYLTSDQPSQTIIITGSHNCEAKTSGETTRRKFTIDEVKAICSFPPDFILCGSYAQQWERLGNSVPPVMMKAIAETIRDGVLMK
jgi:DNA (cytosine-5)-methyltransferase 1